MGSVSTTTSRFFSSLSPCLGFPQRTVTQDITETLAKAVGKCACWQA
ncbi:hypothetical protein T11_13310 [Trichinella zimbabwensis]|uniref:Uncharacterized protein n=1 Tax=Trichinella zimbabwensis TaxID=268475 RepID=A0A0V1GD56_9BILA|nr:hypothetical protein T11_13310 [Trichinella zimbabwensis]